MEEVWMNNQTKQQETRSLKNPKKLLKVTLGKAIGIEELVAVARYGAEVAFSESYKKRVNKCRQPG